MKIVFGADISFNYIEQLGSTSEPFSAMQEASDVFLQADFSVANLENIFGERRDEDAILKSGPNLISGDEYIAYIDALSPTIVALANNHSGDYGDYALNHTIDLLKEGGYTVIGAGKNLDEAYKCAYLEKDTKVAILAVCENEFGIATKYNAGTAGYNLTRVTKTIQKNKALGYDTVVYFHGGNETNPFPSPGKVELYRHFIDLGAIAVIGMHTHCPQGYEIYEGKPIVYSMGNFFFPATPNRYKSWWYGYISQLDITKSGIKLSTVPYKFDNTSITLLKGDELEKFEKYVKHLNAPLSDEDQLQDLFDSWCLTQAYFKNLSFYKDDLFQDGKVDEVKHLKNLFGCEAHNELLTNTTYMIYKQRVQMAQKNVDNVKKLQNMEI